MGTTTLQDCIESALVTLRDEIENGLLDETYPEDRLHEIADGAIPIYTHDVFQVAANSPEVRHVDDPGLVEGVTDVEKIIQVAIYEQVYAALSTALHEAQRAADDEEDDDTELLVEQEAVYRDIT